MSKGKKIILCVFIAIMLMPLTIYADSTSKFYSDEQLKTISLEEIVEECDNCLSRFYEIIDVAAGFKVEKSVYETYYTKVYNATIDKFSKVSNLRDLSDETFSEYYKLIKQISGKVYESLTLTFVKEKFETEYMMRYNYGQIQEYIKDKKEEDFNDNKKYDNQDKYFDGLSDEMILAWYDKRDKLNSYSRSTLEQEMRRRGLERHIDTYDFNNMETDADIDFWKPTSTGGNTELTTIAQRILGVIQVFGSISSVIVLVIIGIKYMLSSVEEKAKYKETMMPYIVGCILVFATSNIASVLYKIGISIG